MVADMAPNDQKLKRIWATCTLNTSLECSKWNLGGPG